MTWSKALLPSRHTTEGVANSFHRVFYYAMGLTTEEIHQPHVGVVTAWDDTVAIHDDVRAVAERVKEQLWGYELTPREFTTIPGFDRESSPSAPLLVSRELIADSVELTVRGHCYDALVGVGASSIALAGLAMAACRLDVPFVLVPVLENDDRPGATDAAATVAALASLGLTAGTGTDAPTATSVRAVGDEAAAVLADRLRTGTRPRASVSAAALAVAAGAAAGPASAEALLHLAAIANECGVAVDVLSLATTTAGQLMPLRGSLAPGGALAQAPLEVTTVSGPARVTESEEEACALLESGGLEPGAVLVLRGQGPRGGPGMPSCERLLDLWVAQSSPAQSVALVTDGRAPARPGVVTVSAVTPEAATGGPLAGVQDGDRITIDLAAGTVETAQGRVGDQRPHAAA
ncbi:MAG TPA: dihydroxy-acid dehydratase, partial [Iamia sp.]|nr:dihydroxy-acid dehydratase [Iamia sp.]